jgi:hypothetical protein
VNRVLQKYLAALLAFGFVAVWTSHGAGSAIVALGMSGLAYGGASLLQRRRLDRFTVDFIDEASRRRGSEVSAADGGRRRRRTSFAP